MLPAPLTSSEMKQWLACQRGWWLRYHRQLRKAGGGYASLPNVGNLVHKGLEEFYKGKDIDPLALVKAEADKVMFERPEYAEQIAKDASLAGIMLEGYIQWIDDEGADAGYEYAGSEQTVEAEIGPYSLRGKIDARLRRTSDGALLQLEHKTVGNLSDIPKYAQSAPQFLTYDLLAYLTKPDGVATDGVILNMLRRVKRTKMAKPPFYGRYEVRHNIDELRAHYAHIVTIGRQIEGARAQLDNGVDHHNVVVPNVGRDHTWSCPCHEVCNMFDDGSDVEAFLVDFWEPYDPWARYKEGE